MTDITAILTAHSEGVLAGPSLVSFEQAVDTARAAGLSVDSLILLDRADAATKLQFATAGARHRVVETNEGDPGLTRNAGVALCDSTYVSFLDGDDLWSFNWLCHAFDLVHPSPATLVAHSEINVIFGDSSQMWFHADSRDPSFDPGYLRHGNYWDALSFGAREVYQRIPFVANQYKINFGAEDWHWNCRTLAAGIDHAPALGTVHFKRRRRSTQMPLITGSNALPWINPITSYAWQPPSRPGRPAA